MISPIQRTTQSSSSIIRGTSFFMKIVRRVQKVSLPLIGFIALSSIPTAQGQTLEECIWECRLRYPDGGLPLFLCIMSCHATHAFGSSCDSISR